MPHGWRSPERSPGSPRACATEPPIPPAIADAFVDRTAIDWNALLRRARDPRERASLDVLRRLDVLRGGAHSPVPPAGRSAAVVLLRLLVTLAAVQTVAGLTHAISTILASGSLDTAAPRVLVMLAFGCAGLLLASASARDRRVLLLLATFTCAASAFARAVASGPGGTIPGSTMLFRGLVPEAFVPAALWQFAVIFPVVRRFTRFDLWSRRISAAVWALSSCLFTVNLAAGYGLAAPWMRPMLRDDPGNLFWHLFAIAASPAFVAIFVGAHRSPAAEQRKAVRLGWALAISAAPLLVVGVARLIVPGVERWMRTGGGLDRFAVDAFVVSGLAAMPVLATLAVIVDRPFAAPALPGSFAELVRTRPLRPLKRRRWLTAALERLRDAAGPEAVPAILSHELNAGVGATSVALVTPADWPHESALPALVEQSSAPIALRREAEPFVLLPRGDREWLDARGAVLAAPLRVRNGDLAAIALLGPRQGGGAYDRTDRWYIATLLSAAAAAWDTRASRPDAEDPALECADCGCVAVTAQTCACGGALVAAALPPILAGKFQLQRRLGAGGMGVVYLARDVTLGRDVALKTLPRRGADAVLRLRNEARAMAALNHSALATIYGVEIWQGTPVLVVEHLARGTLADRLRKASLTRDETIALGIRLTDALVYMHDRGLLHRDIKPSNIGFTADGTAKLLDFGLSDTEATAAGTPGYLPPDARSGALPDAATDLWSVGVVLQQTCGAHDAALASFFQRALASEPAARFRSAREMRAALERLSGARA